LGAKFLVVLCAGSALLLVKDALTSIVNGTLVGVSLSYQASPSGVWLFPTGLTYLGFLLREKLAVVLIIPSSWGSQLYGDLHHHRATKQRFFWRRCRGKRRLLQGEFHTLILYFVLSFALLYFYLHHFCQKHKKISFLIVVTLLLFVHYVVP
jgi:hypothetical protein